ncbi:polynucleotide 5'-hydroxyl-kinase NOL9 [Denticeps clupeoides]|uniref:Polynucleotide 5'-hydroxyl-kinase NOL9 n=1 Tax=Denticeps clupeoides TaxID=299321 RepID=A0AAY4ED57_9TELE|nr:polynucleotide 5'-hydroxyl-kinase NOL9 [Denticeps clupeoides]
MKVQKGLSRPKHASRNGNKRHPKNSKWRTHGRAFGSDSLSRAKLEHQLVGHEKPGLKRLKKQYPKAVDSRDTYGFAAMKFQAKPAPFSRGPPHTHTNGQAGSDSSSNTEDSQDWRSYAQTMLHNGVEGSEAHKGSMSERLEDGAQFHAQLDHTHNRTVLAMQPGQSLCFRGKCLLTCLYGRVEVFGFNIEEGQQPYPLYSPPSHCPLTIIALSSPTPSSKSQKEGRLEAKAILRNYLSPESLKHLLSKVDSDTCLVLLEPMDTPLTRFLMNQPDLSEIFGLSSKELGETIDSPALSAVGVTALRFPAGGKRGLFASKSYRDTLHSLLQAWGDDYDRAPIILVCGAKNSGKSTFSRHLINTLLNHTASVDYLECDLGQTEFTPPGCLSLSTVTEPLLGPPFTHQREPEHMVYYGQATCQSDMDRYLESLKLLWRHYSRETPVVINTMGWVKGPGFQLLVDLIRFFSVTHVVQLSFGDTTRCPTLTPEFLRSAHGWQTHPPPTHTLVEVETQEAMPGHVLYSVQSEFEGAGTSGEARHQRSNELRDLAMLAYFSKMQGPDPGPVRPLHCFIPYQVSMSAVALGVTHREVAPAHILYAANASLVGLCCVREKVASQGGPALLSRTPICQCVGLGVVRGIDMERGLYLLVTPVSPSLLKQVNCLLLGEIALPKTLLTTQPGAEGDLPYVTTDYSFEITGAGKLTVYKGLARPCLAKTKASK